jgi:site-specific recombinase XerD
MITSFTELQTLRGLDVGPLCPHIDRYIGQLYELGYCPRTIRSYLQITARLNAWLVRKRYRLWDLSQEHIERFLRWLGRRRRPSGFEHGALCGLLAHLRQAGITRSAKLVRVTPAQRWVNAYSCYLLDERGCTEETRMHYALHVERFLVGRFASGRVHPSRIQAHDVVEFIRRDGREHRPYRTKQAAMALRSFLHFLHYRGHHPVDLSPVVPAPAYWRLSGLPKHLPAEAVQRVLDCHDRSTALGRRNYAILLLLARLGLRAGEVIALQLEDIDWENAQLTIRSKKGGGWGRLPLPKDVGVALARYLRRDRPACSCRAVFVRAVAPHRPIARSAVISGLAARAIRHAGVDAPRSGAHVFRHSLATNLLRHGASLEEIGQILRHRDPETTAMYAKVDLDALRRLAVAWPGGVR